ncbi:MAG: D-alanyl-D-alanine carboxypeptidase family protein [Acidobacteriota bacterium]|nr:D-alanyl-D-alanine carboxypeptidase family protein [Acidobacteriota bacterium]
MIRIRTALLIAAIFSLAAFPCLADDPTKIDDFTQYTYSVRSAGVGSAASFQVTRTFNAPIVSLHLYIVAGSADDYGFVGSKLVTDVAGMCQGVGSVTGVQEVSDQVTITGDTASFTLVAVENCCCNTGWGSATQGDRTDATFEWVVTLAGAFCDVAPIAPITDPLSLQFEAGNTVDTNDLNTSMQTALTCLQQQAQGLGGGIKVTSAFRPIPYQTHIREVWDKEELLKNNREPGCAKLKDDVDKEFHKHTLLPTQRPATNSAHTRGEAIDINWTLPPGTDIDSFADHCDLKRPVPKTDKVHFIHK